MEAERAENQSPYLDVGMFAPAVKGGVSLPLGFVAPRSFRTQGFARARAGAIVSPIHHEAGRPWDPPSRSAKR